MLFDFGFFQFPIYVCNSSSSLLLFNFVALLGFSHFSAATFRSMRRFSFAREHNEGAALCVFFYFVKLHTHSHSQTERETRATAGCCSRQTRDTRQTELCFVSCFCLLAANCATLCEEHERRERMSSAAGEHRVTTETELTYEHRAQPAQASPTVDSRRESEIQKNVNVNLPAGIHTARESTARCYSAQRSLLFWSVWAVGCGP